MEARYRYRLRVTTSQARQLQAVFDSCRFAWNQALGRWTDLWRHEATSFSYGDMSAELTDWRGRYDWLREQPQTPQQQALRDLGKSIAAFFDKKNPAGRPTFKSTKRHGKARSARWTKNGFALRDDRLHVAVAGGRIGLRVVWSRPLPSIPKSVTVYRDPAGRWLASFVVQVEPEPATVTGRATGLDVGLTTFATTEHDDSTIPNPRYARRAAKALARSQRNTARKAKGSNSRQRAVRRQARIHATVADQRRDFAHKQARTLARWYDRIGVEDLRVKNMIRKGKHKRGLNRSIADAGWGDFLNLLEWHARKAGHEVIRLPAANTTQTCSECGTKAKCQLRLQDRTFRCDSCGLVLDRDRNAARNLNPNRPGWRGEGDDGAKTRVSAETPAA